MRKLYCNLFDENDLRGQRDRAEQGAWQLVDPESCTPRCIRASVKTFFPFIKSYPFPVTRQSDNQTLVFSNSFLNSHIGFTGLAYCVGGRSLFWGGWSPRLLDSETPAGVWPQAVLDEINAKKVPNGDNGYFRQSSQQIGVSATNDFIFGELHNALREQLHTALAGTAK